MQNVILNFSKNLLLTQRGGGTLTYGKSYLIKPINNYEGPFRNMHRFRYSENAKRSNVIYRIKNFSANMTTIEQYTEYLFTHQAAFNLTEISRLIRMDASNLKKAVIGKTDGRGNVIKIPKRCLPLLKVLFSDLSIKIPGD